MCRLAGGSEFLAPRTRREATCLLAAISLEQVGEPPDRSADSRIRSSGIPPPHPAAYGGSLAQTALLQNERIGMNETSTVRDEIEATARAVVAVDQAYIHNAIESVNWQRRGLLKRLTRVDPAASLRPEIASATRMPLFETIS